MKGKPSSIRNIFRRYHNTRVIEEVSIKTKDNTLHVYKDRLTTYFTFFDDLFLSYPNKKIFRVDLPSRGISNLLFQLPWYPKEPYQVYSYVFACKEWIEMLEAAKYLGLKAGEKYLLQHCIDDCNIHLNVDDIITIDNIIRQLQNKL